MKKGTMMLVRDFQLKMHDRERVKDTRENGQGLDDRLSVTRPAEEEEQNTH